MAVELRLYYKRACEVNVAQAFVEPAAALGRIPDLAVYVLPVHLQVTFQEIQLILREYRSRLIARV